MKREFERPIPMLLLAAAIAVFQAGGAGAQGASGSGGASSTTSSTTGSALGPNQPGSVQTQPQMNLPSPNPYATNPVQSPPNAAPPYSANTQSNANGTTTMPGGQICSNGTTAKSSTGGSTNRTTNQQAALNPSAPSPSSGTSGTVSC